VCPDKPPTRGGVGLPLANDADPGSIVLDATNVYCGANSQHNLMRVAKTGGMPVSLASSQPGVFGLSIDAHNLYWATHTNPGSVMQMPIGGGTPIPGRAAPR